MPEDLKAKVAALAGDEPEGEDRFDLDELRLNQNFGDLLGIKKAITTVRVGKPRRQDWVRAHPDPERSFQAYLLNWEATRETYLVHPDLSTELGGEIRPAQLTEAVTTQGEPFIWIASLVGADGRSNSWVESLLVALVEAKKNWVRVTANMDLGRYKVFTAPGELGEPLCALYPGTDIGRSKRRTPIGPLLRR